MSIERIVFGLITGTRAKTLAGGRRSPLACHSVPSRASWTGHRTVRR
jgi:hypothetical protein